MGTSCSTHTHPHCLVCPLECTCAFEGPSNTHEKAPTRPHCFCTPEHLPTWVQAGTVRNVGGHYALLPVNILHNGAPLRGTDPLPCSGATSRQRAITGSLDLACTLHVQHTHTQSTMRLALPESEWDSPPLLRTRVTAIADSLSIVACIRVADKAQPMLFAFCRQWVWDQTISFLETEKYSAQSLDNRDTVLTATTAPASDWALPYGGVGLCRRSLAPPPLRPCRWSWGTSAGQRCHKCKAWLFRFGCLTWRSGCTDDDTSRAVQFSSVQFSSVQFSSVQFSSSSVQFHFSSVQFSSVQFGSVQFSSIQFSSVPFRSVPFRSVPVPFRSVPFRSVQFTSVPFRSVQFSSVQFSSSSSSVQFSAVQFSSVQFSSVQFQFSSIPFQFSSVQFSSVRFSSVQFSSVQFSSVPFRSVPVPFRSVPFRSVQFSSVPFRSVQFSSVPVPVQFSSAQFSSIQFSSVQFQFQFSSVQRSSVQFSSVQFSSVQFSSVQFSSVQFSSVQFSSVQRSSVQFSSVQFSSVQFSSVQFSSVQFSSVQFSSVQFSSVQFSSVQRSSVQFSSVQFSSVQFSSVQFSSVQFSSVQFSSVQFSAVQFSSAQFSSVQFSSVQFSSVQFSSVQFSSVQFSAVQFSLSANMFAPLMSNAETCTHSASRCICIRTGYPVVRVPIAKCVCVCVCVCVKVLRAMEFEVTCPPERPAGRRAHGYVPAPSDVQEAVFRQLGISPPPPAGEHFWMRRPNTASGGIALPLCPRLVRTYDGNVCGRGTRDWALGPAESSYFWRKVLGRFTARSAPPGGSNCATGRRFDLPEQHERLVWQGTWFSVGIGPVLKVPQ